MRKILDVCPGCGRIGVVSHGPRCAACYSRERRSNPEKRLSDNASSRAWKRKHPDYWNRPPSIPSARPAVLVLCWVCGNHMLDPDSTGMCGFCKKELEPWEKLMAQVLPGQDGPWHEYFQLLDNEELATLIRQASLERMKRTRQAIIEHVAPKMTDLYRRDGSGNLVGTPDHHRRCPECGELAANCKGHGHAAV